MINCIIIKKSGMVCINLPCLKKISSGTSVPTNPHYASTCFFEDSFSRKYTRKNPTIIRTTASTTN